MKITTLKEFQEKFKSLLDKAKDKELLIEKELKDTDTYLNEDVMTFYKLRKSRFGSSRPKRRYNFELEVSDFHREIFAKEVYEYNIYDKELDIDSIEMENYKDISRQAYEFSKYINWLRDLNKKPQQKKSGLSHKQKMLALHYLGLDFSQFENTGSAKILSQILDLDYDNTRKYLSYVALGKNEVRTKDNLKALTKLFDVQGFEDISKAIEEDIQKLS